MSLNSAKSIFPMHQLVLEAFLVFFGVSLEEAIKHDGEQCIVSMAKRDHVRALEETASFVKHGLSGCQQLRVQVRSQQCVVSRPLKFRQACCDRIPKVSNISRAVSLLNFTRRGDIDKTIQYFLHVP